MRITDIYSSLHRYTAGCVLAFAVALGACAQHAPRATAAANEANDVARLVQVEARLAALQLASVDAESYAFAEARAWYEFAYDVYAQGERGRVMQQALAQAESILDRIECCGGVIHVQAPVAIANTRHVRADLWSRLARLQQHERFACAQGDIARMRVQLIAAGHAYWDFGWRHARPYVQAAQRLGDAADEGLKHCGELSAGHAPKGDSSTRDAQQPVESSVQEAQPPSGAAPKARTITSEPPSATAVEQAPTQQAVPTEPPPR
jgi:OmpA-OmpF porin, OOP family